MVTEVVAVTELVLTVKVALLAPPGMLTLAGTVAAAVLLLERLTTTPDDGAAALSVTVPCDGLPPTTLVGLSVNALSTGVGGVPLARTLSSAIAVWGLPLTSLRARSRTYFPLVVGNDTSIAGTIEAPGHPVLAVP